MAGFRQRPAGSWGWADKGWAVVVFKREFRPGVYDETKRQAGKPTHGAEFVSFRFGAPPEDKGRGFNGAYPRLDNTLAREI